MEKMTVIGNLGVGDTEDGQRFVTRRATSGEVFACGRIAHVVVVQLLGQGRRELRALLREGPQGLRRGRAVSVHGVRG